MSKGISILRAAAAFNRSMISVRNQARKLGMPFPTVRDRRLTFQCAVEKNN